MLIIFNSWILDWRILLKWYSQLGKKWNSAWCSTVLEGDWEWLIFWWEAQTLWYITLRKSIIIFNQIFSKATKNIEEDLLNKSE